MSAFHVWGDPDFDWKGLTNAGCYLEAKCRLWGRVGINTKEKYGTLRVSTLCAFITEHSVIHSIIWPGYYRTMWPYWVTKYIDIPLGKFLKLTGVLKLIQKYQLMVFKHFWKKAAKKWPHIAEEILDEYDFIIIE